MALSPGDKLGPYEIAAPLGAGGMGEVYRARDAKLNRDVAIKVLPAALANDTQYMARFEREAQMLAALNHPNIATVYGIEQGALVMELVEGADLKGPLPLDEAIAVARQIAAGLEAAHERGIIHRDLKPANIKLTPAGVVKILDFGLAKSAGEAGAAAGPSATLSPTLSLEMTRAGMILGTAAYMSPEQARGKVVDRRTDIWAFGVVLYEMVTGHRLFEGEDLTETLAKVVRDRPDLRDVPAKVRPLLERCLEKDAKKRLRDIGDMELLLAEAPVPATTISPRSVKLPWIAAAVLGVALAGLGLLHFRETAPEARLVRSSILPPDKTVFEFGSGSRARLFAISPDGRRVVFAATSAEGKTQLWIRPLDALSAQPLLGTEGAALPFWSPDSRYVGFVAGGKLQKIDISGGPPVTLADAAALGGSWSPEGVIVFAPKNPDDPLQRISAAGGTASQATALMEGKGVRHRFPWFLPDGRHFLYAAETLNTDGSRLFLHVAALDSKDDKVVGQGDSNAIYSEGHLLFLRQDTLMAQPFDPGRLATTGEALPAVEKVAHVLNPGSVGCFSASGNGLLLYRSGTDEDGPKLTWFDRAGKPGGVLGEAQGPVSLSPDRKSLAAVRLDPTSSKTDIWIYDVARNLPTRFTFYPGAVRGAVWSPDGRTIAFASNRKGRWDLYRKPSNMAGTEEVLYGDDSDKVPTSWSMDGKFLLYWVIAGPKRGLWALPMMPEPGGTLKPVPFLQGSTIGVGTFSPDGRWVVYESSESQRVEIYVAPFPGPGGKRQISTAVGRYPRWRADGKEIFFGGPDVKLMAAEVTAKDGTLEVGAVRPLLIPLTPDFYPYDVSADGQRILSLTVAEQKGVAPLTLMQNWTGVLKK